MPELTLQQAFDLASAHHQAGRLAEAEQIYRLILAQNPAHAGALHNLGFLTHQTGRPAAAAGLLRQSIAADPTRPESHSNLGNILREMGQLDESIAACRAAIALNPNFADAHNHLGNALNDLGRLPEAAESWRRAIALNPRHAQAHSNLGTALFAAGQIPQAIAAWQQAISLNPNSPDAFNNLGIALKQTGQFAEALAAFHQAITLRPDFPEAHNNLGITLHERARFDEAITAFRRALSLRPAHAQAEENLGNAFLDIGQLDDALAAYRRALAINPNYAETHSDLLHALHLHPALDPQTIADEHRRWNQQHAEPLRNQIQPHTNVRDPARKLRIGYVSADFSNHPVGRFMLPIFLNQDRASYEIFAYSDVATPDAITTRLQSAAHTWRLTTSLSHAQLADQIRRDQIDILVDLAGHTNGNRLLTFARKPAPIQLTYLGYPDTTGLTTIDYRLTDSLADPQGVTDPFCVERLIRLPRTAWCFYPPDDAPPISPLPAIAAGHITFASFNYLGKVNEPLLKLWAQILRAVPNSKLLLKARGLNSTAARQRILKTMSDAGISEGRLELLGFLPPPDHLARYHQVDIALDTFPYHGTTTTCEALWMGVPVITLAGQTHASRVGISLLSTIALPELIAHSPDQFIQIAANLAADLPRLAELRATLRHRMQTSPLMDAPTFTRDLESAYRQIANP